MLKAEEVKTPSQIADLKFKAGKKAKGQRKRDTWATDEEWAEVKPKTENLLKKIREKIKKT